MHREQHQQKQLKLMSKKYAKPVLQHYNWKLLGAGGLESEDLKGVGKELKEQIMSANSDDWGAYRRVWLCLGATEAFVY